MRRLLVVGIVLTLVASLAGNERQAAAQTGVIEVGGFVASVVGAVLAATQSSVDESNVVVTGLPFGRKTQVDLGVSYQFAFGARFEWEDRWEYGNENAFGELHVLKQGSDGNFVALESLRIPEQGYFEQESAWFDDSTRQVVEGTVDLMAKQWSCPAHSETVWFVGLLWNAAGGRLAQEFADRTVYDVTSGDSALNTQSPETVELGDFPFSYSYQPVSGVPLVELPSRTIGLSVELLDKAVVPLTIDVDNPFSLQLAGEMTENWQPPNRAVRDHPPTVSHPVDVIVDISRATANVDLKSAPSVATVDVRLRGFGSEARRWTASAPTFRFGGGGDQQNLSIDTKINESGTIDVQHTGGHPRLGWMTDIRRVSAFVEGQTQVGADSSRLFQWGAQVPVRYVNRDATPVALFDPHDLLFVSGPSFPEVVTVGPCNGAVLSHDYVPPPTDSDRAESEPEDAPIPPEDDPPEEEQSEQG